MGRKEGPWRGNSRRSPHRGFRGARKLSARSRPTVRFLPHKLLTVRIRLNSRRLFLRAKQWRSEMRNPGASDPTKRATRLQTNWGHASARQLKRVLADAEGGNRRLSGRAYEAPSRREVCRALEEAPHLMRNFKWTYRFRATQFPFVRWTYTPSFPRWCRPVRQIPFECGLWVTQDNSNGSGRVGLWHSGGFARGGIYLAPIPGKCAHPWLLEHRKGLARGSYNWLPAGSRFASRSILEKVQSCLTAMLHHGGFSVYR